MFGLLKRGGGGYEDALRRIIEHDKKLAADGHRRRLQAERRRLAHEYVIAVVNAGKILGSPTSHVGLHKPAEDAQHGLSYADALIAATTPESEAKS